MTPSRQDPARPRRTALPRQDREALVLDTAQRLFYERGVRSVGMDELVAATGLGKATVYRLFATKDALVEAYLERLRVEIVAAIDSDLTDADGPVAGLLRVLDAVEESVQREGFRGCPFNNASIEYADPAHPVRRVAAGYREDLRARLRSATGDEVGDQLAALVDGAYTSAAHLGADGPAAAALSLARDLVRQRAATPRGE